MLRRPLMIHVPNFLRKHWNWGKDRSACTVAIFGETISQTNYSTKVNGIVSLARPVKGLPLPYRTRQL